MAHCVCIILSRTLQNVLVQPLSRALAASANHPSVILETWSLQFEQGMASRRHLRVVVVYYSWACVDLWLRVVPNVARIMDTSFRI